MYLRKKITQFIVLSGLLLAQESVCASGSFDREACQKMPIEALEAKAGEGSPEVLNCLGERHHFGIAAPQNFQRARGFYEQAVLKGSAAAANHLGRLYANGEGVQQNRETAEQWYKKSTELDPSLENVCLNRQHPNKALNGLVIAALQGSAPAEYELANLFEIGAGIPRDSERAVKFYRRAAERNFAPAAYHLSHLYREGRLVTRNESEARNWEARAREIQQAL